MRLSELKTGESGIVVKILGHGAFRKRVIEMGFVKGQVICLLYTSYLHVANAVKRKCSHSSATRCEKRVQCNAVQRQNNLSSATRCEKRVRCNAVQRQDNLSSATRRSRGAEKGTTPKGRRRRPPTPYLLYIKNSPGWDKKRVNSLHPYTTFVTQ